MNTPVSGLPSSPTPNGLPSVKSEEVSSIPSAVTTEKIAVTAQGQLAEQTGNILIATPSETHIIVVPIF